jgi:hypothetical protein
MHRYFRTPLRCRIGWHRYRWHTDLHWLRCTRCFADYLDSGEGTEP